MRSVPFEFDGVTYHLSFTAEAMFTVFEKYGEDYDVIASTHCGENTVEGWKAACWLGALLAAQGELQRRYMGEEAVPMLTAERLRTGGRFSERGAWLMRGADGAYYAVRARPQRGE